MQNCIIYDIPANEAISSNDTNCVDVCHYFSGVYIETEKSSPLFEVMAVKNRVLYPTGDHVVGVKYIPDMVYP
jgi:hypothetical protein